MVAKTIFGFQINGDLQNGFSGVWMFMLVFVVSGEGLLTFQLVHPSLANNSVRLINS